MEGRWCEMSSLSVMAILGLAFYSRDGDIGVDVEHWIFVVICMVLKLLWHDCLKKWITKELFCSLSLKRVSWQCWNFCQQRNRSSFQVRSSRSTGYPIRTIAGKGTNLRIFSVLRVGTLSLSWQNLEAYTLLGYLHSISYPGHLGSWAGYVVCLVILVLYLLVFSFFWFVSLSATGESSWMEY